MCSRKFLIDKFDAYSKKYNVGVYESGVFSIKKGFSNYPCVGLDTLYGNVDFVYVYFVLNKLSEFPDDDLVLLAKNIIRFQSDDGWFYSGDKQNHSREHATAYAFGAITLLASKVKTSDMLSMMQLIKPLTSMCESILDKNKKINDQLGLSALDKVHIWRGSHKLGGVPAILGMIKELRLENLLTDGFDVDQWLSKWSDFYLDKVDAKTGYWKLAPMYIQLSFDMVYRIRHKPLLAKMGGAVHLYWIYSHLGVDSSYPNQIVRTTLSLQKSTGLYENEPYCIDLDAVFMLAYAMRSEGFDTGLREVAERSIKKNREAVLSWLCKSDWSKSSHKLPGALAAVAEADKILKDVECPFVSPLKYAWWL